MDETAPFARLLGIFLGDPEQGYGLATALHQLHRDLAVTVPSLLAVSFALGPLGAELPISTVAPAPPADPVLASLAVPLSVARADTLILRAAAPGAFLLLADDLRVLFGPGNPPLALDGHLTPAPILTAESVAAFMAAGSAANRHMGALIEQGASRENAGGKAATRPCGGTRPAPPR